MTIQVLYDLSALAPVVHTPSAYTGVQRVVHKIAQGLRADERINLTLHAQTELLQTEAFARQDRSLASCKFVHDKRHRLLAMIGAEEAAPGTHGHKVRSAAALMRHMRDLGIVRREVSASPRVRARVLSRFQVYHSPAFALPDEARQIPRLRCFQTIYDLSPVKFPDYSIPPILQAFEKIARSVSNDDYFLCISQHTKDNWCEYTGVDPQRCFITPLAAADYFAPCNDDARTAAVRARCGIPDGAKYFLSLGRIEPRKNLIGVISAFSQLLKESGRSDLYLVLVGGIGWKAQPIFDAAQNNVQLRSRVVFPGYVPEEELAALYSGARAFVYMSFYEGFGLPPLEAMRCRVPVICSNSSSLPEVVGDGGILLAPEDRTSLCAALSDLADNEVRRDELAQRASVRAAQFTWKRSVDATIHAYEAAIR